MTITLTTVVRRSPKDTPTSTCLTTPRRAVRQTNRVLSQQQSRHNLLLCPKSQSRFRAPPRYEEQIRMSKSSSVICFVFRVICLQAGSIYTYICGSHLFDCLAPTSHAMIFRLIFVLLFNFRFVCVFCYMIVQSCIIIVTVLCY